MRRSIPGVTLAFAALAGLTAPASADNTGLFNSAVGNCGYGYAQSCAGYGQGAPIGLASLTVTMDCTAVSPFAVDRTGVACHLFGLTDRRTYLHTGALFVAGNVATIANSGTVPFQGYKLCVGAGYSTPWGEFKDVQGFRCE